MLSPEVVVFGIVAILALAIVSVVAGPRPGGSRFASLLLGFGLAVPAIRVGNFEMLGAQYASATSVVLSAAGIVWAASTRQLAPFRAVISLTTVMGFVAIWSFRSFNSAGSDVALTALYVALPLVLLAIAVKPNLAYVLDGLLLASLVLLIFSLPMLMAMERFTIANENPIWLGRVAAFGILAACMRTGRNPALRAVIAFGNVFLLYATDARGAGAGLLGGLAWIISAALIRRRMRWQLVLLWLSVTIGVTSLFLADFSFLGERVASVSERGVIWRLTAEIWMAHPIAGTGDLIGREALLIADYTHNWLLELLAQGGLAAAALFVGLCAFVMFQRGDSRAKTLVIVTLLFATFSGSFWTNYELWMALAIGFHLSRGKQPDSLDPEASAMSMALDGARRSGRARGE